MIFMIPVLFAGAWYLFSFSVAVALAGGIVIGVVGVAIESSRNDASEAPAARTAAKRSAPEQKGGRPVHANLRITYEDRNGEVTTRDIRTISYVNGEILAYCKLRRANRTFMTSRVKEAVDLDTGEIIGRLPTYFRGHRDEA